MHRDARGFQANQPALMSTDRIGRYHVPRARRRTPCVSRFLAVRWLRVLVSADAFSSVCDYNWEPETQFTKGAVDVLRTACSSAVVETGKWPLLVQSSVMDLRFLRSSCLLLLL